jgi:hypothetical protein
MEYVNFILHAVPVQSNITCLLYKHSGWHLEIWVSYTPSLLIEIIIWALFTKNPLIIPTLFINNTNIIHNIYIGIKILFVI